MKSNIQDLTPAQAKSILQKIASGDDWFGIGSAPKDGVFLTRENDNPPFVIAAEIYWGEPQNTPKHLSFNHVTHWKHLTPAKHMAMMIEREVNENE